MNKEKETPSAATLREFFPEMNPPLLSDEERHAWGEVEDDRNPSHSQRHEPRELSLRELRKNIRIVLVIIAGEILTGVMKSMWHHVSPHFPGKRP